MAADALSKGSDSVVMVKAFTSKVHMMNITVNRVKHLDCMTSKASMCVVADND